MTMITDDAASDEAQLSSALSQLHQTVSDAIGTAETTPEEYAELYVYIDALYSQLKTLRTTVADALSAAMGRQSEIHLPGIGRIEKATGKPRKAWEHQPLARAVASRIIDGAVDPITGEVVTSVEDQIAQLLTYAHVDYWKATALAEIGLSADHYCTTGDPTTNIIFRKDT